MKSKKSALSAVLFVFFQSFAFSAPLHSPTWGFTLDLPEEYEYSGGDGREKFSFETPEGAKFDLVVYYGAAGKAAPYSSVEALAQDVQAKLNSSGETDSFEYRQKKAFLLELDFSIPGAGSGPGSGRGSTGRASQMSGWALCLELGIPDSESAGGAAGRANNSAAKPQPGPLLLAMAYGPAEKKDLQILHLSALDSIAPEAGDRLAPGPITEFGYPRGTRIKKSVFALGLDAWIFEKDAEAAQSLVDREFQVLRRYTNAPTWQEAWSRFYRAIYRDSFDRLADIAFQVERKLNVPSRENRDFADQVLHWVQSFEYERDFFGSDFQNLVTAATEGRGDCDPRSMLWAIILKQANIPAAIMVSRHYSHAMGLADLEGEGAHFEVNGQKLLVAEPVGKVSVGLIGETVSDIAYWLGILFE